MLFLQFQKTILDIKKRPIFDIHDLTFLFGKERIQSKQLSRWQEKGYITKVRKGLYIFTDAIGSIHPYLIANLGYYPSYISLETALHEYGFIPEVSQSITSVSTKKTYSFSGLGTTWYYKKIKNIAFIGYAPKIYMGYEILIAEPEKALVDFFYLNLQKCKTEEDIEELRLNYYEMKEHLQKEKMRHYAMLFESQALHECVARVLRHF